MLGNMGPRKEWIWENIHSLCNKLNNEMQEKKLNNKICVFFSPTWKCFFKIFIFILCLLPEKKSCIWLYNVINNDTSTA